jgi:hypothetical protein
MPRRNHSKRHYPDNKSWHSFQDWLDSKLFGRRNNKEFEPLQEAYLNEKSQGKYDCEFETYDEYIKGIQ